MLLFSFPEPYIFMVNQAFKRQKKESLTNDP